MVGIYKITSPIGKVYIGQSINVPIRWKDYISRPCKKQIKLNRSFIKYSINAHIFEVVEQCDESKLNERERFWQDHYDVTNKELGLNCRLTKTGDKSGRLSEDTKAKISKVKSYTSDETRMRMSKSQKGNSNSKGKITSEETKRKLAIASTGVIQSKETIRKKIDAQNKLILNMQTGIFYFGAKDASDSIGISVGTFRSRLRRKSHGNYLKYV